MIPSLITIVFGYFIYGAQMDLQTKVDNTKNELAFQSALREEFYKRRLSRYEDVCKELADAEAALNNAGVETTDVTQATLAISKFDRVNKGNTLYWSPGLQNGLDEFWALGIKKLKNVNDPAVNENLDKKIAALHEQMKKDLNVPDLGTIMKQSK